MRPCRFPRDRPSASPDPFPDATPGKMDRGRDSPTIGRNPIQAEGWSRGKRLGASGPLRTAIPSVDASDFHDPLFVLDAGKTVFGMLGVAFVDWMFRGPSPASCRGGFDGIPIRMAVKKREHERRWRRSASSRSRKRRAASASLAFRVASRSAASRFSRSCLVARSAFRAAKRSLAPSMPPFSLSQVLFDGGGDGSRPPPNRAVQWPPGGRAAPTHAA